MAMPPIMEKLLNLQKKVDELEAWRYMRIGGVVDVTAPDLPLENCMWADGSLALFDLWPELKAKYEQGGFSGLLLPYNCSDANKAAYPLKWVPDSAKPTGLFIFRLTGLFARYCSEAGAGVYQADAVQTGITMIRSRLVKNGGAFPTVDVLGNVSYTGPYAQGRCYMQLAETYEKEARHSVNQRFADRTRPENVATPVALYLGRSAEV